MGQPKFEFKPNSQGGRNGWKQKGDAAEEKAEEEYQKEYENLDEQRNEALDDLNHLQGLLKRVDP